MISRKYRITTKEFSTVSRGKSTTGESVRISISKSNILSHPKIAVVVPKKIAKTAVVRNKIRRQVYSYLSKNIHNLPSAYITIFLKQAITTELGGYEKIKQELSNLLWLKK